MNEKLNLVEILKDYPKGTRLYSPLYGEVSFEGIDYDDKEYPITTKYNVQYVSFAQNGRHDFCIENQECMLFPSKDVRTWDGFQPKKPKFDPKILKPFDKVLVKKGTESHYAWYPDFICLPPTDVDDTIFCIGTNDVAMVIPYNNDTKHLIGKNEEAPYFYKYWED